MRAVLLKPGKPAGNIARVLMRIQIRLVYFVPLSPEPRGHAHGSNNFSIASACLCKAVAFNDLWRAAAFRGLRVNTSLQIVRATSTNAPISAASPISG